MIVGEQGGRGERRILVRRRAGRIVVGPGLESGYDPLEVSRYLGDPIEGFRFTQGSSVWSFTSADTPIYFKAGGVGAVFSPEVIVRSGLEFSQEEDSGGLTVEMTHGNPVAQLFRSYIPTSPVSLTVFRRHRADPEETVVFTGKVIACQFEDPKATLTCISVAQTMRRLIPSVLFESQCNWNLYGPGCGVDRSAGFTHSGTVDAVSGRDVDSAVFSAQVDGYFTSGWLQRDASSERRFIVRQVGARASVMNAFSSLQAGDAITAFAGCDRTEAVCLAKFNNLARHLGFPRIPTRNPYDGSLV